VATEENKEKVVVVQPKEKVVPGKKFKHESLAEEGDYGVEHVEAVDKTPVTPYSGEQSLDSPNPGDHPRRGRGRGRGQPRDQVQKDSYN
jgi:hypothetical protein